MSVNDLNHLVQLHDELKNDNLTEKQRSDIQSQIKKIFFKVQLAKATALSSYALLVIIIGLNIIIFGL